MTTSSDLAKTSVPVARGENPIRSLQSDVNRLFNDFFGELSFPAFDRLTDRFFQPMPALDISSTDKAYTVTAEVPGMDSKDIQLSAADGYITLKGEKSQETKTEDKGYVRRERSYGSFQRIIELPKDAEIDAVKAEMRNGILTLTVPRNVEVEKTRKIDIHEVA